MFATIKKYLYVIDFPENDKAIIVNVFVTFLFISFFLVACFAESLPSTSQIANLEYLHLAKKMSLISILTLNILLLFILYIRRTNPGSMLPNNIQVYVIGQPLALFAVLNGMTQLITGLLLGMLPFIGLILFNRKHVFYATCIMWIEIISLAVGVSLGVLPNAPLYIDAVKAEQVPLAFSLVQLIVSLPVAVVMYVMGHALMQGLVLKEKKILELSRTDALTGLWNRRYLNELLEHEIAVAHRDLYCLSIIMLDLDFFKKINDTYGHHTGDKVLIAATKVLQQCARSTDYVGRFGGEEFLAVLPNCDAKIAEEVANRYRTMLAEQPIHIGDEVIHITGSFGFTTMLPSNQRDYDKKKCLDLLINTADNALYDAKNGGRNCVKFRVLNERA